MTPGAAGLEGTGLEGTGLEGTGLEGTGLGRAGLERAGLERAGLERAGLRLDIDDTHPAGTVATVTLDRPSRRNAMTPLMWRGLASVGAALPARVRVVVVRGAGPSFCAGLDRRLLTPEGVPGEDGLPGPADPGFEEWIASCQEGFTWLRRPEFVTIAAVQGHAIGGGFQLALACDLRVLADDAKLCMKEPALGLVPDLTGTKPLADLVGLPRAIELCLTTRTIDAAQARELRLAEIVVPLADLDAAVTDLVAALLATDASTARATKALLQQAQGNTLAEQAAAERHAQAELQRGRLAR
jgi:enoyl-CoA hydratase/carnithine racemase